MDSRRTGNHAGPPFSFYLALYHFWLVFRRFCPMFPVSASVLKCMHPKKEGSLPRLRQPEDPPVWSRQDPLQGLRQDPADGQEAPQGPPLASWLSSRPVHIQETRRTLGRGPDDRLAQGTALLGSGAASGRSRRVSPPERAARPHAGCQAPPYPRQSAHLVPGARCGTYAAFVMDPSAALRTSGRV